MHQGDWRNRENMAEAAQLILAIRDEVREVKSELKTLREEQMNSAQSVDKEVLLSLELRLTILIEKEVLIMRQQAAAAEAAAAAAPAGQLDAAVGRAMPEVSFSIWAFLLSLRDAMHAAKGSPCAGSSTEQEFLLPHGTNKYHME